MSVNQRVQDILIGAIFGIILGIIGNLWASVFDHLFLENASKDFLYVLLVIFSIGTVAIAILLWTYARKLGR